MSSRQIVVLVLFALLGTAGRPSADLARSGEGAIEAHHPDGSSCPDGDADGHACGPGCPCACCPGHRPAPALLSDGAALDPARSDDLCVGPPEASLAEGVLRGVFHPPRV